MSLFLVGFCYLKLSRTCYHHWIITIIKLIFPRNYRLHCFLQVFSRHFFQVKMNFSIGKGLILLLKHPIVQNTREGLGEDFITRHKLSFLLAGTLEFELQLYRRIDPDWAFYEENSKHSNPFFLQKDRSEFYQKIFQSGASILLGYPHGTLMVSLCR